jgi:hypothetical protein
LYPPASPEGEVDGGQADFEKDAYASGVYD